MAANWDDGTIPRAYSEMRADHGDQDERLREEAFLSLHDYINAFNVRFGEMRTVFEGQELHTVFPLSGVSAIPIPPANMQHIMPNTDTNYRPSRNTHAPVGHPHRNVIGVVDALQDLAEAFVRRFAGGQSTESRPILKRTFAALKHMEILARYDGNRDAIIRHGALDHLATILKAGCSALRVEVEPTSPDESRPRTNIDSLKNVLLCAVLVIQRCTDPASYWETFVRTGGERPLSTGAAASDAAAKAAMGPRTVGLLTQCVVWVLAAVQDLHVGPNRQERYVLLSQCINALGCLTACNAAAVRERLHLVDGIPVLCRLVGWPAFLKVIADGGDEPWRGTSEGTLRYEFKSQLLSWNLLQFLSGSRIMQKEMREAGAFENVTKFFEWVAWCGSALGPTVFAAREGSYDDFIGSNLADRSRSILTTDAPGVGEMGEGEVESEAAYNVLREALRRGRQLPPSRRRLPRIHIPLDFRMVELELLFRRAYLFCLSRDDPSVTLNRMRSNSIRTMERKSGFQDAGLDFTITERTLQMIIRLFDEQVNGSNSDPSERELEADRARVALGEHPDCSPVPRLQLLLLDLLVRMMQAGLDDGGGEAVRKMMDDLHIWQVLSSQHFFAWRMHDTEDDSKSERERMRGGVISFLGYVGTLPNLSNLQSCQMVLSLLEREDFDRAVAVKSCCVAFRTMLRACPSQTQASLLALRSLDVLVPMIRDPAVMGSSLRWGVLSIIDLLFHDNQDVCLHAFLNRPILGVFFSLLVTEEGKGDAVLTRFALDRIVDVMNVMLADFPTYAGLDAPILDPNDGSPRSSLPEQETAPDLLGRYVACFPSEILSEEQCQTQALLLMGLREVIRGRGDRPERRRRVQRAMIRNKVFHHVLSVLSVKVFPENAVSTLQKGGKLDGMRWYRRLAEESLRTLAELVRENENGKRGFREVQGYEEIRVRVFVKGGWKAWEGFLNAMFVLAFDGVEVPAAAGSGGAKTGGPGLGHSHGHHAGWTSLAGCLVRNRDAVSALVKMYDHFDEALKGRMVEGLISLCEGAEVNRVAFLRCQLVGRILRGVLPSVKDQGMVERVVELVKRVAGYSVSVADVRLFLACLREKEGGRRRGEGVLKKIAGVGEDGEGATIGGKNGEGGVLPFWYDKLLEGFVDVAGKKEADLDFFHFSGRGSGIVLPKGEKWPATGGWTFVGWVKVDGGISTGSAGGGASAPLPGGRTRRRSSIHLERPGRKGSVSVLEGGRRRRGSSVGREGKPPPGSREGQSAPNRPRIFSLLTIRGDGVEICIGEDGTLQLIVARGDRTTTVPVPEAKITPNKWHFIAVAQAAPNRWGTNSVAWVHVDGEVRWKGKIDFPETAVHPIGRIGASGRMDLDDGGSGGGGDLNDLDGLLSGACFHCFAGQMGSVYIFDDFVSPQSLKGIWKLGPGHSSQFRGDDLKRIMEGGGGAGVDETIFDGSLSGHLALQYHPTATRGNEACFDVSPRMGGRGLIVNVGGFRTVCWSGEAEMRGVLTVQTGGVSRAVHALGGVSVLFPILGQVGVGVEGESGDGEEEEEEKRRKEKRMGKRTSLVLRLLAILVRSDSVHREGFMSCRGPRVVSGLVQQMKVGGLNMEVLDGVMALVRAVQADARLAADLESALVFEPRLWACAPLSVQVEYFEFLGHYLLVDTDRFKEDHGVAFWIDVLTQCYWYIPPRTVSPDFLARLVASRPRGTVEIRLLRRAVWEVIRIFLKSQSSVEDVGKVVQCLSVGEDGIHVGEVLAYLLEFAETEKEGGKVLDLACQAGFVDVLFDLCMNVEERTRVMALQALFSIMTSEDVSKWWKRKARMEDLSGVLPGAPGGGGGAAGLGPACGARVMARVLSRRGITEKTHHALLQCGIEERVLDRESQDVLRDVGTIRNAKLSNPGFLYVGLELVVKGEEAVDTRFRAQVMQDALVIANGGGNAERVRSVIGWQVPYMMLVAQDGGFGTTSENEAGESGLPAAAEIESRPFNRPRSASVATVDQHILKNLGMEVLVGLILDAFTTDRKAWKWAEETTALAFLLWRESDAVQFVWAFLARMVGVVRREVAAGDWRAFGEVKMGNILHLLILTEELMFHHQDMVNALYVEMSSPAGSSTSDILHSSSQKSIPHPSNMLSLEEIKKGTKDGALGEGEVVRVSYPVAECNDVVQECLEVMSLLIDGGITNIEPSDALEKTHFRPGGLFRMILRILLSAVEMPDDIVWHMALQHLLPLIDRHAMTFAQVEPRTRVWYVLGHIHDAFLLTTGVNGQNTPAVLDYRVVLPLYMLTVTRWRDLVVEIKDPYGNLMIDEELVYEGLESPEKFHALIQSVEWTNIYNRHFIPAMKGVEEESFAHIPLVKKRYARTARNVYVRYAREEAVVGLAWEHLDHTLRVSWKKRHEEETSRQSEMVATNDAERRMLARRWAGMFRELSRERGIWAPLDGSVAEGIVTRWKLDRAENYARMRKRLIPNWDFDDHRDAAARRDKEFKPDSPRSPSSPRSGRGEGLGSEAPLQKYSQLKKLKSSLELGLPISPELIKEVSSGSLLTTGSELEEGEDEWNVVNDAEILAASAAGDKSASGQIGNDGERFIYGADCEMILLMTAVKGRLEITTHHISFIADVRATTADLAAAEREATLTLLADNDVLLRERRWPLSQIRECYLRRYMLRKSALEIFFINRTNYLFNFPGGGKAAERDRNKFMSKIIGARPPNLISADMKGSAEVLKKTGITEKWQKGEISNFDYLMFLNTISGRTYNDLTQYPVFPWILKDYQSETLDLSDPSIYRDLSKPVGALDPARLAQYVERYHMFEDPTGKIKKFHYGTHYSSAAAVLFYLLRTEPFTTLHIALQAGKFDHPDRQFHSMQSCWHSVTTGSGDVKEIIPEFFYMPEFLVNENEFNLGRKQRGELLNDVILPPWAKSPEEFIRIHREALEGDYVSAHLHEWIDLIWGYKQTGEEAVKAVNVFYYLTYEGAIDIDSIADPVERRSIEDQINNFGQTPSQLFKKPHVKRLPKSQWVRPTLFSEPAAHKSFLIQTKTKGLRFLELCGGEGLAFGAGGATVAVDDKAAKNSAAVAGAATTVSGAKDTSVNVAGGGSAPVGERVVTVDMDMNVVTHKWSAATFGEGSKFHFETEEAADWKRRLPSQPASNLEPHPGLFALTRDGRYLLAGGFWDASFQLLALDHGGVKASDVVHGHTDVVTCLALAEDGRTVVTGSRDTTVMAWQLESLGDKVGVKRTGRKVYCGHDEEITTVAVNVEHDIVVSGSTDGTVIIHTLHEPRYLRTIRPQPLRETEALSIYKVIVTKQAEILIYSEAITPSAAGNSPEDELDIDPLVLSDMSDKEIQAEIARRRRQRAYSNAMAGVTAAAAGISYLHCYSINGKPLSRRAFTRRINCLVASGDGKWVVGGDDAGGVVVLEGSSLRVANRFDVSVPVESIALSQSQQFLFLGRQDGRVLMIALDGDRLAIRSPRP
ncbi:Neurobeachin-like protein 1 [Rhizophlyctis rosea]|nr:Neurobeachin-like protein 1 [Rhizophlyctis rosea]